jgi:hypothetical protein
MQSPPTTLSGVHRIRNEMPPGSICIASRAIKQSASLLGAWLDTPWHSDTFSDILTVTRTLVVGVGVEIAVRLRLENRGRRSWGEAHPPRRPRLVDTYGARALTLSIYALT